MSTNGIRVQSIWIITLISPWNKIKHCHISLVVTVPMIVWIYQRIYSYKHLTSRLLHLGQWIFEFTNEYVTTNLWPLRFYTLANEYLNLHNEYVTTNLWPLCFYGLLTSVLLHLGQWIFEFTNEYVTTNLWPLRFYTLANEYLNLHNEYVTTNL